MQEHWALISANGPSLGSYPFFGALKSLSSDEKLYLLPKAAGLQVSWACTVRRDILSTEERVLWHISLAR